VAIHSGSSASFEKAGDSLASERSSVCHIEHGESNSVKACQPCIRANPQVTIASLRDRKDGVLWQASVGLPIFVNILPQLCGRIQRNGSIGHNKPLPLQMGAKRAEGYPRNLETRNRIG
jgi:hypothetical protein